MGSGLAGVILFLVALAFVGGAVVFWAYRRVLRRAKGIERGLKMVPLQIHLPAASHDTASEGRDIREVVREKIGIATTMYDLIAGVAESGFKSKFYGQRHMAFEIVATGGKVYYYAAVPVALVSVVKQALVTAYPGARLEEVEDHNIFNEAGKIGATTGGELVLKENTAYPIATYRQIDSDPMQALLNPLSELQEGDGVGIQIMLRPAGPGWTRRALDMVRKKRQEGHADLKFGPKDLIKAAIKVPEPNNNPAEPAQPLTNVELAILESVEEKTKHPGFETLIRLLVSSNHPSRSDNILRGLTSAFALFDAPGLNGFKFLPSQDPAGLATAFIFRFFPPEIRSTILNSEELATIFHLPEAQFTATSGVERQPSKQVDGPPQMPTTGLRLGYNLFRGAKKDVLLQTEDRRRHTYIVGQTGTGKSTLLENLAVQDMLAGNGLAFIDPHGDTTERLISMIPKARAEDVIYFNPADTQFPMGLNLFEFQTPEQKDFLIQETINMLYKLYDPGHTGIIGPRYEHWYRNAALTLMSDPGGATFIEIPKVFTDSEYLKQKFKYVTDPTVVDFWTKEMGQTSDYHKSEMLGWFVSKFGAFMSNEMMRNIIGQTKSAFNLREVMDQKKILLVNLSKGQTGELNSQLLGMIFVMKFQAAAMSRAAQPEAERTDFCLYVDEFQNFSTDSFASILSEARKYRLNLIVANQFIGQLSQSVRESVFGNVGTVVSYRTGPEDADFLVKQFAPVFDAQDLVNLPNYQAVIRMMIGGLPSQPFSLSALPPVGVANAEMGSAIKQLSAAKYGHPKSQIETEILGRLQGQTAPPEPPVPEAPGPAAPAPATVAATAAVPQPPPLEPVSTQPPSAKVEPKPDRSKAASSDELKISDIVKNLQAQAERNVPIPKPPLEPAKPSESTPQSQNQAQAEINQLLGVETPVEPKPPVPAAPPPAPVPVPAQTPPVPAPPPVVPSPQPPPPVAPPAVAIEPTPQPSLPAPVLPTQPVKATLPPPQPAKTLPQPPPPPAAAPPEPARPPHPSVVAPASPPKPAPAPAPWPVAPAEIATLPKTPVPAPASITPSPKPPIPAQNPAPSSVPPVAPPQPSPRHQPTAPLPERSKQVGPAVQPERPRQNKRQSEAGNQKGHQANQKPKNHQPNQNKPKDHPRTPKMKVIQPPVHPRPAQPKPVVAQLPVAASATAAAPPPAPAKPRFTINAQPIPQPQPPSPPPSQPKQSQAKESKSAQPGSVVPVAAKLAPETGSKLAPGEVRVDENGNVVMG